MCTCIRGNCTWAIPLMEQFISHTSCSQIQFTYWASVGGPQAMSGRRLGFHEGIFLKFWSIECMISIFSTSVPSWKCLRASSYRTTCCQGGTKWAQVHIGLFFICTYVHYVLSFRDHYAKSAIHGNNTLTIGEQWDAIQNFYNPLLQNFCHMTAVYWWYPVLSYLLARILYSFISFFAEV